MVRLNKNQLSKEQLDGLFTQFSATLGKLGVSQTDYLLTELLGQEERVMLAKRLACIILLLEENTPYKISRILKMSPSTVLTIQEKIDTDQYAKTIGLIKKNKVDYLSILDTLEHILHGGGIMPRRYGLDRYRGVR